MATASMDIDNGNGSETLQWLTQCKSYIRSKMEQNIDIRAAATENLINSCINTIINDTNSNNITSLILLHNETLNIQPLDLFALKHKTKEALYVKVDNWKGLCNFKTKSCDFKSYKKNANGWWNRHASQWIGDYFVYPLLHDTLPQYIRQIIGLKTDRYVPTNLVKQVSYDLMYFSISYDLFYAQCSTFPQSKDQPLIPTQSFLPTKCKQTLQQLFITLGGQYKIPWVLDSTTKKGGDAANYARKWIGDIFSKTKVDYNRIMATQKTEQKLDASCIIYSPPKPTLFRYRQREISPMPIPLPLPPTFDDNKTNYDYGNNIYNPTPPPPVYYPVHNNNMSYTSIYNYPNNDNTCVCNCNIPPMVANNYSNNNVSIPNNANNTHVQYKRKPYRPFRKRLNSTNISITPSMSSVPSNMPNPFTLNYVSDTQHNTFDNEFQMSFDASIKDISFPDINNINDEDSFMLEEYI